MKRFLVVCAVAMLCCSLAKGQEAEDTGRGAELSIIPRVDVGLLYDLESKSGSFNFGNTSFYTLFEGQIVENLSFSIENHWIASDWSAPAIKDALLLPTRDLYHLNMFGSGKNANNFVDWIYLCWEPLDFEFTLGKQLVMVGGFEYDDYDFDVNPLMTSELWNTYACYQWGFKAAWNIPNEIGKISLQATTNAVNRSVGLALGWDGTYGPYSMRWSVLASPSYLGKDYPQAPWNVIVSLGNMLELGDFNLKIDYTNACGDPNYICEPDYKVLFPSVYGNTIVSSLQYTLEDSWDFGIKGAWNKVNTSHPYGYTDTQKLPYTPAEDDLCYSFDQMPSITAGAWASWYPLGDPSLRIQASAGVNSMRRDGSGYVFAMIGATYNFSLKLW